MDIQLMDRWNNLSVSEIRVLREIATRLDREDERIPIRAVAQASYVSTASIVRLAKKLGFDGYSELLYSLKHERAGALPPDSAEYGRSMLVSTDSLQELNELARSIASGSYERFHILGLGYSDLIAHYFCDRLLEHGYFASTKSPLDFRDERSYLVIFVSESGETKDLTFVQDRCVARQIDDFLFTTDSSSSLGVSTAHCILVSRRGYRADKTQDYFAINCLMLIEDVMAQVRDMQSD